MALNSIKKHWFELAAVVFLIAVILFTAAVRDEYAVTEVVATTTTSSTSTTTTIPPTTTTHYHKPLPQASRKAVAPRPAPYTGDIWSALARCESGGRPDAVSRSGKYYGAFQFSLATWRSMGMSGRPIDFPYDVQLDAAKRLQARSGWGQWPTCSRKLGLR